MLHVQSEGEVKDSGSTVAEGSVLLRGGHTGRREGGGGEREGAAENGSLHHDSLGTATNTLPLPHPADIHPPLSPVR